MKKSVSQVAAGLLALAAILCVTACATEPPAGEPPAGAAETGLEANRPQIIEAPALPAMTPDHAFATPGPPMPVPAAAPAPAEIPAPAAAPPLAQERSGKLANYILNNASIRKTQQLRSDPRLNLLPMAQRGDFLNEYGALLFSQAIPSRDSLLARTHDLDAEQMEMADRETKFEDAVVAYRMDEAVLSAKIDEYNKTLAVYTADLNKYRDDVAQHNRNESAYESRLAQYQPRVAAHNSEVANYGAQCTTAPLPPGPYEACVAWQRRLLDQKARLDAWKAQLDAERAGLEQTRASLNARGAALQQRAQAINTRKTDLDAQIAALEQRRLDLVAEQKKLTDWQATLQPKWDFELKLIDAWRADLDRFNARLEQALNQVHPPQARSSDASSPGDKTSADAAPPSVKAEE